MKRSPSLDADRISELPSNVMDNILSCLPIEEAVRTGILSKQGRGKWVHRPHLLFDSDFCPYRVNCLSIIAHILLLHRGPITKFVFTSRKDVSFPEITHWINYISQSGVQHLDLDFSWTWRRQILPTYFFSCAHLREVTLCDCNFKPPPTFQGFSHLLNLKLMDVKIETSIFESLILNCPLLEELTLMTKIKHFRIISPSLKFMTTGVEFISIYLDTPLLSKLSLHLECTFEVDVKTINFDCLHALQELRIPSEPDKILVAGNLINLSPTSFYNLTTVELGYIEFDKVDHVSGLLLLMKSSPNLEKLEVMDWLDRDAVLEPILEFWEVERHSDCMFNKLQTLKITESRNGAALLEFFKFILGHSPSLVSLDYDHRGDAAIFEQVLSFKRLSPIMTICDKRSKVRASNIC